MVGCFIGEIGYYEGDKSGCHDTEVPKRPDYKHIWNGKKWVINDKLVAEENKIKALEELNKIDLISIRSIREYLTGNESVKAKALEFLVVHESKATEERSKMGLSIDVSVVEKK